MYISNKPFIMGEYVFVGLMTHATIFGGSLGILSTARPELSYPCVSKAKSQVKIFQRGRLCDYIVSHV